MEGSCDRSKNVVLDHQPIKKSPKKPVKLVHAVSLIVGSVIGSGIFIAPEAVLTHSGSVVSALVVWLAAGIISTLGALCFAELGTTYPKCGGTYKYLKEMYGPLPSFVILWSHILVIGPCVSAILSRTLANNVLAPFYDGCKPPQSAVRLIAAWTLCLIAMINCYNKQFVLGVQTTLALAKVLVLATIISLGLWTLSSGFSDNLQQPFSSEINAKGVALAMYNGLFAFSGWSAANDVVGQLEKPHRNLPLAIGLSLPLVTIVYVLVNMAYFTVLPYDSITSSASVAVTFGQQYAYWLAWIIPACIALSIYGTLNGKTYTSALVIQISAREGQFPYFGSMVHKERKTLIPVFVFQCILDIVYVNFETFTLISIFSFVSWFAESACIIGLVFYRFKRPDLLRPFKNPLIIPAFYICICILLVVVPAIGEPSETVSGFGIVVLGIPAYYIVNKGIRTERWTSLMRKLNLVVIGMAQLTFDDTTE